MTVSPFGFPASTSRNPPPPLAATASCCCGLNTIVNLPAPAGNNTDGAAINVSSLQGRKTLEISGTYQGSYAIMGSHDGNLYFPLFNFNTGSGPQTIRQTVDAVVQFMRVHSSATNAGPVTVNVAARSTVACAANGLGGANSFFSVATLLPGASGPQASLDLFSLVAATGVDVASVACGGTFRGQIAVEASLDGLNFSPLASFSSSQAPQGSGQVLGAYDPSVVPQVVRYVRANVLPGTTITGPTSLTIGGPQNCTCSGAGCSPVGLHTDGSSGAFTLTGASTSAIILGTAPYDFTCTGLAHVSLNGTVDSKSVAGAINDGQLYPTYGIFIVTVVPPAANLFTIIPPDVQITTVIPTDALFHTFTDGPVVEVNPGAGKTIVFAVKPNEFGTAAAIPTTYNYKNFILSVVGV